MNGAPAPTPPPKRRNHSTIRKFSVIGGGANITRLSNAHSSSIAPAGAGLNVARAMSENTSTDSIKRGQPSPQQSTREGGSKPHEKGPPPSKLCRSIYDSEADSVIGSGVEMHGDFEYAKLLRIDGKFQGSLTSREGRGDIIIGSRGCMIGEIVSAQRIVVEEGGHVFGNIDADEVVLRPRAVVKGDITCKYIEIIGPNVVLHGRANIHRGAPDIIDENNNIVPTFPKKVKKTPRNAYAPVMIHQSTSDDERDSFMSNANREGKSTQTGGSYVKKQKKKKKHSSSGQDYLNEDELQQEADSVERAFAEHMDVRQRRKQEKRARKAAKKQKQQQQLESKDETSKSNPESAAPVMSKGEEGSESTRVLPMINSTYPPVEPQSDASGKGGISASETGISPPSSIDADTAPTEASAKSSAAASAKSSKAGSKAPSQQASTESLHGTPNNNSDRKSKQGSTASLPGTWDNAGLPPSPSQRSMQIEADHSEVVEAEAEAKAEAEAANLEGGGGGRSAEALTSAQALVKRADALKESVESSISRAENANKATEVVTAAAGGPADAAVTSSTPPPPDAASSDSQTAEDGGFESIKAAVDANEAAAAAEAAAGEISANAEKPAVAPAKEEEEQVDEIEADAHLIEEHEFSTKLSTEQQEEASAGAAAPSESGGGGDDDDDDLLTDATGMIEERKEKAAAASGGAAASGADHSSVSVATPGGVSGGGGGVGSGGGAKKDDGMVAAADAAFAAAAEHSSKLLAAAMNEEEEKTASAAATADTKTGLLLVLVVVVVVVAVVAVVVLVVMLVVPLSRPQMEKRVVGTQLSRALLHWGNELAS